MATLSAVALLKVELTAGARFEVAISTGTTDKATLSVYAYLFRDFSRNI